MAIKNACIMARDWDEDLMYPPNLMNDGYTIINVQNGIETENGPFDIIMSARTSPDMVRMYRR